MPGIRWQFWGTWGHSFGCSFEVSQDFALGLMMVSGITGFALVLALIGSGTKQD